jgi:very-short-patch-repair endonuclease
MMAILGGLGERCTAERIRLFAVRNVHDALEQRRLAPQVTDPARRFVACLWPKLPDMPTIIDGVVKRLGKTAQSLWPQWYGTTLPTNGNVDDLLTILSRTPNNGSRVHAALMSPWLKASARRCTSGRVPVPKGFSNAAQLRQLALAIAPDALELLLCTESIQQTPKALLGLARAAEWIARETNCEVTVFVPQALAASTELDNINFSPFAFEMDSPDPPNSFDLFIQEEPVEEKVQHCEKADCFLWPVQGRPHPNSPGEQLLAKRLEEDETLCSLFEYNAKIHTVRSNTIQADLVWHSGKIAVEVDGYHWHRSRASFSNDRNRDYELLISGYLVLRIPHDEIMNNVETAIRKIRDVVRFRRAELSST